MQALHVRRHEAELRLEAAENNLKRADDLRKTAGKTIGKPSETSGRSYKVYKLISEEIKKIEAGSILFKTKRY